MPIYEYACNACGHQFEVKQKFSDPPIADCLQCGKPVRKVISAPGIIFKGTGWYVTDYSNKLKEPQKAGTPDTTGAKTGEKPAGGTDGASKTTPTSGDSTATSSSSTGTAASSSISVTSSTSGASSSSSRSSGS